MAIENHRIVESLILDLLCLDQEKSLLKVPLCALKALQINPGALHPATNPKAAKLTIQRFSGGCKVAYQSNLQRSHHHQRDVVIPQKSFQSHCSGTELSVTTISEIDDECERLIATIKRSAAEYISGYT